MKREIEDLTERLRLSPYQAYVLENHAYKYDLRRLKKIGSALYAPYQCKVPRNFKDAIAKLLFGPRADLIGTDRMLASDERRININAIMRNPEYTL